MGVNQHGCVSVTCDDPVCGNRAEGGWDEGAPHFDNETEALSYVLGDGTEHSGMEWTRRPSGLILCRSCSEAADCEATGHQHVDWLFHGQGHPSEDRSIQWRYCKHCGGGFEERLTEMVGE